ncbi:TonB-dependent receptor plug domain-containing protein [Parathalassolituus penaei]|uniref:TonB-dependent receptor n=1 Tax=Parathalassolituus penaei TaxID=2997323 RepID=A0A9X3EBA9_9GAMM|nr:TonB-dependent receptor [Parathalassolituus penaei]MCY0964457.1 TonB-dependent receptor [Parathalassolituus penaei]
MPAMPEVLTATRLRQPRSEVPASMTIIEAEQIEAWGVRTLPELMRFVPGMFVGHGDDENNPAVVYHASSPNVMRRLQVLVDGRSVYRAGIASVVWDDIPVALEDIQRIEVTRGPNSASWGANSFLGVINIVTRHPADTAGTRLRYRTGSQGVDDGFVSHSWQNAGTAWRVSGSVQADDGFDGANSKNSSDDQRRDSRRHGFVNFSRQQWLDNGWQWESQGAVKRGHTDIRKESYDLDPPDQDTDQAFIWNRLSREFNADHSLSVQGYWQYDHRRVQARSCAPVVGFEPALFDLYRSNPQLVNLVVQQLAPTSGSSATVQGLVGAVASGAIDAQGLQQTLNAAGYDVAVSDTDLDVLQQVLANSYNGSDFSDLSSFVCGDTDRSMYEERFDLEVQDTRRWNDQWRSVLGVNLRRDQALSTTYFDGIVNNDTYRLFGTLEYRPLYWLLLNLGGSFETEDVNGSVFSPRLAANFLLTPEQSIRLVYSEAVRSPDLLEQDPEYSIRMTGMDDNYLGITSGRYYMNQWAGARTLDREHIVSHEVGYYGRYWNPDVELDIKLYHDDLYDLISDPIALNTLRIASDTRMEIRGAEMQLGWRPVGGHWLWLNAAHTEASVELGDISGLTAKQIANKEVLELRMTPSSSLVASWHYQQKRWGMTLSHFWYDAYNDFSSNSNRYRRYEMNVRTNMRIGRFNPWVGVWFQHQISDDALVYNNQRYGVRNIGFVQIGLNL